MADVKPHEQGRPRGSSSVWQEDATPPPANRVASPPARVDVCVVGAGIAGLTTAYLLAKEGASVAVLDAGAVGGGETGRTTAHLASVLDDRFTHLESLHGRAAVALHHQSHAAAIDRIESIVADEGIACRFQRVEGRLYAEDGQDEGFLAREAEAAGRAGAVCAMEHVPVQRGQPARPCLRFPAQAAFHPIEYIRGLAAATERLGVTIHTGARVKDLSGDGPVTATLSDGREVTAGAGVAATNVPSVINHWPGISTKTVAYRTYVVGLEIGEGLVDDALLWDTADPYHYVRLAEAGGRRVLIVGGADHRTGSRDAAAGPEGPYAVLETWARAWFPDAGPVVSRWSGQVSEPVDGVAFIGRVPTGDHERCFAITGDSGMGLTHGTLGAILLADLIAGRDNPWRDLYDPARRTAGAVKTFISENAQAAAKMLDHLGPGEVGSRDGIPRGAGAIVRDGLHKLAVYRDGEGRLHERSAVCPHLKCVVRWNELEESWDCPCHGSRFAATGGLIIGPAVDDLKGVEPRQDPSAPG